jgi:hypothetical protein
MRVIRTYFNRIAVSLAFVCGYYKSSIVLTIFLLRLGALAVVFSVEAILAGMMCSNAAGIQTLNEVEAGADARNLIGTADSENEGTVLKRQLPGESDTGVADRHFHLSKAAPSESIWSEIFKDQYTAEELSNPEYPEPRQWNVLPSH